MMSIIDLSEEPQLIPLLAEWHHREWSWLNPGDSLEKRIEKMQSYLDRKLVPSTFVYKYQGQPVGSAALVHHDMDTRPDLGPWLASVFVVPEYRRRGIGTQLVRHVMQVARENGIDTLYLFTPDQAGLYGKMGWEVLAEEDYRGHAVTVMRMAFKRRRVRPDG